jgi:hypothetical protein
VETFAALRALEDAAVGTRGYVPPEGVDELATALADLEALSADPSLLLGDNEKEKVEDFVERAMVVLESMNRGPPSACGPRNRAVLVPSPVLE